MNRVLGCIALLLLTSCARNDQPAEVTSPRQVSKTIPKPPEYYQVKTGDTLASVAQNFDISEADIVKLNKLRDGAPLVRGQRLLVKPRNKEEEQKLAEDLTIKPLDSYPSTAEEVVDPQEQPIEVILGQKVVQETGVPGRYRLPVQGTIIRGFGPQPDGSYNKGINISAPKGIPVKAIADGVVKYAGSKAADYGKMVMIKHQDGNISTYAHLNTIDVKQDLAVRAGSKIGTVGSTGNVSQPQLNLQIRSADKSPINPATVISGLG